MLIVEPGAFRTSFSGDGLYESAALPEYEDTVGPTRRMIRGVDGAQPGDPALAAAAILTAIDAHDAPLRLPLGGDAVDGILRHLRHVTQEVRAREHLARATAFPQPARTEAVR